MDWNAVDETIRSRSLLSHPFYQAWSCGTLSLDDLRLYAAQYYHLEAAFPRFLSRIHSSCAEPAARQRILENLVDEERGPENHRELWLRFCDGLGLRREDVVGSQPLPETRETIDTFMELASDRRYSVGLSALYAYESQAPEVAASKIDGLRRFYGISDPRTLGFFETHREVDVWHSREEKELVLASGLPVDEAARAASRAAGALRHFLDGVDAARLAASPA